MNSFEMNRLELKTLGKLPVTLENIPRGNNDKPNDVNM